MKASSNRQKCSTTETSDDSTNPKLKCVHMVVFQEAGKTIIQPLATNQDAEAIRELFQTNTLEVWLSNGKSNINEFDVSILKYKQVAQPLKKCSKLGNRVCLKNYSETIVSCEKCPAGDGDNQN